MIDNDRDKKDITPTKGDEMAADAAANEGGKSKVDPADEVVDDHTQPNPPHTTTAKWFTTPKFGSAGSGGLENEPGPEKD